MRVILKFLMVVSLPFAMIMHAAEVRVFAAASLTDVLKEMARGYDKESGDKVVFNFGASNFLARQIEAGAPADIFFSADEAQMDSLQKKNFIAAGTRRNRLSNSLVVVVASDASIKVDSAPDLAKVEIKRVALADPAGVPAGIYAREYLQRQDLWAGLEKKIVPTENVRAALAAVESGNVEAAIVYKTDASISKKSKIAFEIPRADTPAIHYPVAVLKDARQAAAARKFLEHLFSSNATSVFERYGFITE